MSGCETPDVGLYTPDGRDGIDMSEEEVLASRLTINAKMAAMNIKPKDRAVILDILGLAERDEFRPEFRPDLPIRLCPKKLHNIGDPANYRIRKTQSLFGEDRVCLACESKIKAARSERASGRGT